MIVFYEHTVE